VNPVKTIVVKSGEASTLRVLHGDQDIKGDATAAQVAIWNGGTESIRPESVLAPVRIVLRPTVPILEAKIRKETREIIGTAVDASRIAYGVVPVSWKILEHNDGAVIQLIYAGPTETEIVVEGIVEGQPAVLRVRPSAGFVIPLPSGRRSRLSSVLATVLLVAFMSVMFLMIGLYLWLYWLRRRRRGKLDLLDKTTPWIFAAMLCELLWLAWILLRETGPPFGF
jgi:hypothetical protein